MCHRSCGPAIPKPLEQEGCSVCCMLLEFIFHFMCLCYQPQKCTIHFMFIHLLPGLAEANPRRSPLTHFMFICSHAWLMPTHHAMRLQLPKSHTKPYFEGLRFHFTLKEGGMMCWIAFGLLKLSPRETISLVYTWSGPLGFWLPMAVSIPALSNANHADWLSFHPHSSNKGCVCVLWSCHVCFTCHSY